MSDGSYVVEPKLNDSEFISRLEILSGLVKQTMDEISESVKAGFTAIQNAAQTHLEGLNSSMQGQLSEVEATAKKRFKK